MIHDLVVLPQIVMGVEKIRRKFLRGGRVAPRFLEDGIGASVIEIKRKKRGERLTHFARILKLSLSRLRNPFLFSDAEKPPEAVFDVRRSNAMIAGKLFPCAAKVTCVVLGQSALPTGILVVRPPETDSRVVISDGLREAAQSEQNLCALMVKPGRRVRDEAVQPIESLLELPATRRLRIPRSNGVRFSLYILSDALRRVVLRHRTRAREDESERDLKEAQGPEFHERIIARDRLSTAVRVENAFLDEVVPGVGVTIEFRR